MLNPNAIAVVFLGISVGLLYYVVWLTLRRVRELETVIKLMEGKPVAVTADQIAQWKAAMHALPAGSPKHTAYKNRLKLAGKG